MEEARSGPGGGGRPSCREGAGGVVRASAAVRGCSNRPPQRRWRRRDPGPAASTVPFVALGGGGFLERPVIALGVLLLVLSLTGLAGALCRASCLLWLFLLILLLFAFTVFAFVVTNRGAGWVVSGRGYKEYRLGDYSTWLQRRVKDSQNWPRSAAASRTARSARSSRPGRRRSPSSSTATSLRSRYIHRFPSS